MTTTANLNIQHVTVGQADKEAAINNIADKLDQSNMGSFVHDMASDADYTLLTASDEHLNFYLQINDTGVLLTTTRNIILPNNKQVHVVFNNTAQSLVFKTTAGVGPTVQAGERDLVYTDGTDVVLAAGGLSTNDYPQDYHFYFPNKPANSATIAFIMMTRTVKFLSGLSNSYGTALVAATASSDFDIQKNGASIGTINWAAAATVATFTFATDTTFNTGDSIKVIAPATQDSTLSGISISISGSRFV